MMWSKLGIGYGNNMFSLTPYPTAQVNSDLDYLKALGVVAIRIALPSYLDTTTISNCQQISAACHARGLYNIWGVRQDVTITSTNWPTLKSAVSAQATICQGWGTLDEFQLGNEYELNIDGSITYNTILADLASLSATIKGNGVTMKLSYSSPNGFFANQWIAGGIGGLGGLDYIAFNVYGEPNSRSVFQTDVTNIVSTFGNRGYLTEWGIDSGWPPSIQGSDQELQAVEFANRLAFLRTSGIRLACAFTYRYDNSDLFCALQHAGNYRLFWNVLKGGRRTFYNDANGNNLYP